MNKYIISNYYPRFDKIGHQNGMHSKILFSNSASFQFYDLKKRNHVNNLNLLYIFELPSSVYVDFHDYQNNQILSSKDIDYGNVIVYLEKYTKGSETFDEEANQSKIIIQFFNIQKYPINKEFHLDFDLNLYLHKRYT